MDYYFDSAFAKYDKATPAGKKEIGKIILPAIKRIQSKIEQSHWIQKLAEMLGVGENAILEELKSTKYDKSPNEHFAEPIAALRHSGALVGEESGPSTTGRKKLIEDKIISLILKDPENLNMVGEEHHCLFCDKNKNFIIEAKKQNFSASDIEQKAVFTDFLKAEEYKELIDALALRAEAELDEDGSKEIVLCLLQLKDIELRNTLNKLSKDLKTEQDQQKKEELIKEFDNKAKELHNLN